MIVYPNRHNPEYLEILRKKLRVHGSEGLLENAVKIASPKRRSGKNYSHCCRIDFLGVAASNLLDVGNNINSINVADCLEDIFRNAAVFNEKGCFIKMRFLFVYPYSAYAFARIQAASTRDRSTIDYPQYKRELKVIKQIDEETFTQSVLLRSLQNSLEQLQVLSDRYNWTHSSLNQVIVRFTPVSPNLCALFVNNTVFSDAYLLAKQKPEAKYLALTAPLVHVEKAQNEATFNALDDHFRYLWELDTTLDSEDATEHQQSEPDTLRKFKQPRYITYHHKAERVKQKNPSVSEKEIHSWKFLVQNLLVRSCLDTELSPNSESLFIACSWEKGKDHRALPNKDARDLVDWLNRDFGINSDPPILSVQLMEAGYGGFLTRQLYSRLSQSTLAVIILTCDIKGEDGQWYSKPNVYHELGYLYRQLGEERIVILREEDVHVPSNITNFVPIHFIKSQLYLCYGEILAWLRGATFVNDQLLERSVDQHLMYLGKQLDDGQLDKEGFSEASQRLKRILH